MLVLTRRIYESIIIGDGEDKQTITILGIQGNQVRIGVEAPKKINVHRKEIYDRIQANVPKGVK